MGDEARQPIGDVVRARRVELVDAEGRLRGVLGEVQPARAHAAPVVGAEFYLPDGEPRVSIGMQEGRAWVTIEMGGNIRIHAGVNDATTEAVDETAYLYLNDADGAPLLGWRVTDDGHLVEHPS